MTISFEFRAPSRRIGRTGKTSEREQRDYYTVTATFRPAQIVTDQEWDQDPINVIDYFYGKVKDTSFGFGRLTRYGRKANVNRWQLVMAHWILKPQDMDEAERNGVTPAAWAEQFRDAPLGVSADVFGRGQFRPFFRASFEQLIERSGLKAPSANAVAIFGIQMRGYR